MRISLYGNLRNLLIEGILVESKRDELINKIGLSDINANILFELFGGRSVWMAKKIIDSAMLMYGLSKEDAIKRINDDNSFRRNREKLVSIKDYMSVGLDGRFDPVKDLTFDELYDKSVEWHKSLEIGDDAINYEEKNDIIIDMRDSDGNGYYWVDLGTNDSDEECNRMGHCGRSNYGTLYSLRSYMKDGSGRFTKNRSHLTASIGDGNMYQLKGAKNSKPEAKYHPYIMELLKYNDEDGDYLVNGFKSEYSSKDDFKVSDLGEGYVRELYELRPELFRTIPAKLELVKLGLMDRADVNTMIRLEVDIDDFGEYFQDTNYSNKIYNMILHGESWGLYEADNTDWKNLLNNYVNNENEDKIRELVKNKAMKRNVNIKGMNLEDAIEELDYDEIMNALNWTANNAEEAQYLADCYQELMSAFGEYGKVERLDDSGVVILIDLTKYEIDYDNDDCDADNLRCLFEESTIVNRDFDKPRLELPDYASGINKEYFNDTLKDRLAELT